MRVLVTGAGGMLGSDFCLLLAEQEHEVIGLGREQLDVADPEAVHRILGQHRPDLTVHTAAHTNADEGELHPDLAYSVNVVGTRNVAEACTAVGAQMMYVSSCGVFDGEKRAPYTELDTPNPRTQHHKSKLAGEEIVRGTVPKHYVLRPGWLFGGSAGHKRNFVEQRRQEALRCSVVPSAVDRFGSPTYTKDFAAAAMLLVREHAFGLYHVVNSGAAARCDYVAACLSAVGMTNPVEPVTSDAFPRSAPMPEWEALDTYNWRLRGLPELRPWQDALLEYARERLLPELQRA